MSSTLESIDVHKALASPASVFAEPADVVEISSLSRSQKLAVLEQWERDARALAVAEEEGLTGGKESMLGRVRGAIAALGGDEADEKAAPTTKG